MDQEQLEYANDLLKVKVHRKPSCKIELEVEAEVSLVKEAHKKAVKVVGKEVTIAGFRKGKAPEELVEKNFKLNQSITDVSLIERRLEYLYVEGKDYLFLDIGNLEQVLIPSPVIGTKVNYLKEGVELKASFYGDTIFAVELPQFLELMVAKTQGDSDHSPLANATKTAVLETGAKIQVPPFIEAGDIIKVDTKTDEYIQRV